jgi:hypothetical protein
VQAAVQDPARILLTLLLVCLLIALVVSYIILRSDSYGWKLAGAWFLAMYGVMTVLSQIETVIYMRQRMPSGMVAKLFLMGAVVAALFAPLALLILGKMRALEESEADEAVFGDAEKIVTIADKRVSDVEASPNNIRIEVISGHGILSKASILGHGPPEGT